jgi:urease accessory protein
MSHTHSHDGVGHSHSHDGFSAAEHGHSHEVLDGPGSYLGREMPIIEGRDWSERAFTVGIGGYVIPGCVSRAGCIGPSIPSFRFSR